MSKRRHKNPKLQQSPHLAKRPVAKLHDPLQEKPAWRLASLDFAGPYSWRSLGQRKLLEIWKKLADFERLTWKQILVDQNYRNHRVHLERLSLEARRRLEELGLDQVESLVSLRLSSRERIWGLLELATLTVLWWDPEHQVCPVTLRHT